MNNHELTLALTKMQNIITELSKSHLDASKHLKKHTELLRDLHIETVYTKQVVFKLSHQAVLLMLAVQSEDRNEREESFAEALHLIEQIRSYCQPDRPLGDGSWLEGRKKSETGENQPRVNKDADGVPEDV